MRSAKARTHDRKRRHKATGAAKTDKSRTRRLANKAKRDEIHAIDPDMKIIVMNQRTYNEHGIEIAIVNGKVTNVLELAVPEVFKPDSFEDAVVEYQQIIEEEHPVIEKIETKNRSALQRLTDRFKKD